jgi:hypothetical protein
MNVQQNQTKTTSKPQDLQMITFFLVALNLPLESILALTSHINYLSNCSSVLFLND